MGCGVDQAHLHIVPTGFRLVDAILADRAVEWIEADQIDPWSTLPSDGEYYLIRTSTEAYVGSPLKPESQYFRKKFAALAGKPKEWNYREWPHYEHIQRTIDHFALRCDEQAA